MHLKYTHSKQAQYCTDVSLQASLPAHTEQGKIGSEFG